VYDGGDRCYDRKNYQYYNYGAWTLVRESHKMGHKCMGLKSLLQNSKFFHSLRSYRVSEVYGIILPLVFCIIV